MNKERNCQARQSDYHGRNDKSTKQTEFKGSGWRSWPPFMTELQNSLAMFWMGGKWSQSGWRWAKRNVVFKDPGNGVDNYRPIYHVYPLCGICRQAGWFWKARTTSWLKIIFCQKSKGDAAREVRGQKIICWVIRWFCKTERRDKNLSMAWVDYGRAFDLVPHSWIIECPDLFKNCRQYASECLQ